MARSKAQIKAAKKKDPRYSEFSITPVRMDNATKEAIQAKADKYAEGNLSAWLRYAGQWYVPDAGEDIPLKII